MNDYPTAGQVEDPVSARLSRTLSGMTEWNTKSLFAYSQIILTFCVLIVTLILISTQPSGSGTAPIVSFTLFFTFFCLLGWCVMLFLLPFSKEILAAMGSDTKPMTFIISWCCVIGSFTGIFNLAAALATTVRIAPGGSCSDDSFLSTNELVGGSGERCVLVYLNIVFLWLGTVPVLLLY